MAFRHAVVGCAFAVARIGADVVGANNVRASERRRENCTVARQAQVSKGLTRCPRERIEQVSLTLVVGYVVEESAEFRPAELCGDVRHGLHDALKIEIARDRSGKAIERLQAPSPLAQTFFHFFTNGDIDDSSHQAKRLSVTIEIAFASQDDPADAAIPGYPSKFLEVSLSRGDRGFDRRFDASDVVRVNSGKIMGQRGAFYRRFGIER